MKELDRRLRRLRRQAVTVPSSRFPRRRLLRSLRTPCRRQEEPPGYFTESEHRFRSEKRVEKLNLRYLSSTFLDFFLTGLDTEAKRFYILSVCEFTI
jgi:hypothetical protein